MRDHLIFTIAITHTKPHIEHYLRQPDNRWLLSEAERLPDTIHLPSIDCHLALGEVYDKVDIVTE
jgi:hypothetical protein